MMECDLFVIECDIFVNLYFKPGQCTWLDKGCPKYFPLHLLSNLCLSCHRWGLFSLHTVDGADSKDLKNKLLNGKPP